MINMTEDAVPIRVLLVTVFESVIEVFLLCLAGYILSRAGVTDKATQRKLNVINVSLFTPALLFSKVAFSLTPAKLKEMWIIPLGFVVITSLSALVAWTLSKIFKLKRSQRSFAICAAMFQNSNSLPIALIQSLVIEVPGLKWGDDDSKDQMLGRALTYLVLYSTLGMMLRWSWGVKLLSQADDEVPDVASAIPPQAQIGSDPQVTSPEQLPHPGAQEAEPFFATNRQLTQDEADESRSRSQSRPRTGGVVRDPSPVPSVTWTSGPGSAHSLHPTGQRSILEAPRMDRRNSNQSSLTHSRKPPTRTESGREFWGLPEYAKPQKLELIDSAESSDDDEEEEVQEDEEWGDLSTPTLNRRRSNVSSSNTRFRAALRNLKHKTKAVLKSVNAFMTVPMYAALLSIFIAMIPPLQKFIGGIKPFEQAVRGAGQCSIPVTLVVLGAFFYAPPPHHAHAQASNETATTPKAQHVESQGNFFERKFRSFRQAKAESSKAYPGENKAVFVAVVSRMFIVPLLMLPFLAAIAKWDLFEAAEDPVFILAAVLLVSSPPALTLAQITQAASGDAFERLISKTITWSYAVLTPPLTLAYVVIGLMFGRL